jgi:hypothetical protein
LVTTAEIMSMGVSLVGGNVTVLVDPIPSEDTTRQFLERAHRPGQKEKVLHVYQFWNSSSPVDTMIVGKREVNKVVHQEVSATEVPT